jgi:hypothetical protein
MLEQFFLFGSLASFYLSGIVLGVESSWLFSDSHNSKFYFVRKILTARPFRIRSCTRSALVLVAAKKCNRLDALLCPGWEEAVQRVIGLLDFWRGDCGDAENRRDILETAMRSLGIVSPS